MTLETIAPLSNDPTVSLPAIASWPTRLLSANAAPTPSFAMLGDTIGLWHAAGTGHHSKISDHKELSLYSGVFHFGAVD